MCGGRSDPTFSPIATAVRTDSDQVTAGFAGGATMKRTVLAVVATSSFCLTQTRPPIDHIDASTPQDVQIELIRSAAPSQLSKNTTSTSLQRPGTSKCKMATTDSIV